MDRLGGLVVIMPVRRAGDPGSNPGPGENFSLKKIFNRAKMTGDWDSYYSTLLQVQT